MTDPEVDWVLQAIKDHWTAGTYSNIPLERVARDTVTHLDDAPDTRVGDLTTDNFVSAALADRNPQPIGSGYDHKLETTVSVRVEGASHIQHGYVDSSASLPPATAGDPVPWSELVHEIRDAILTDRVYPAAGDSNTDYTDARIINEASRAASRDDYYRHDFDVQFRGYETLP